MLRPYVVCAWTLEIAGVHRRHQQRVLPDGCVDIVWSGESSPFVVGPMTRSALATAPAGTTLVGLRFRPAAAARVFGVAIDELTDRHVPLDHLWRRAIVADASERLIESRTPLERVRLALELLADHQGLFRAADPLVEHAISLICLSRSQPQMLRLARIVGASERHLRRRFVDAVGYGPKRFQRILRFQRLLALSHRAESPRLDQLALLAHYADQAHMTREVSEFAGVSPSLLIGNVDTALTHSDLLAEATDQSGDP